MTGRCGRGGRGAGSEGRESKQTKQRVPFQHRERPLPHLCGSLAHRLGRGRGWGRHQGRPLFFLILFGRLEVRVGVVTPGKGEKIKEEKTSERDWREGGA